MKTPAPQVGAGPKGKSVIWLMMIKQSSLLTLSSESLDLAVGSDLVVLEDGHLDLLPLVLDLLGCGLGSVIVRSGPIAPRT